MSHWTSCMPLRLSDQDNDVVDRLEDLELCLADWSVYDPPEQVWDKLEAEKDLAERQALLKEYEQTDAETNFRYHPYNENAIVQWMTFPTQVLALPRKQTKQEVSQIEKLSPEILKMIFDGVEDVADVACLALSCKTLASFAVAYDRLTYDCKRVEWKMWRCYPQLDYNFHIPGPEASGDRYGFLITLLNGWVDLATVRFCEKCMKFQSKDVGFWHAKQAKIARLDCGYIGDAWRKATEMGWLSFVLKAWVEDDGPDDAVCPTCFIMSNPTDEDAKEYQPNVDLFDGKCSCCDSDDSDTDPYRNERHKYAPYKEWAEANGEKFIRW